MFSLYLRTNGGFIKNSKVYGAAEKYSYSTSTFWMGNFIKNRLNGLGKKIIYNNNSFEIFIGNFVDDLQQGEHIYYSFSQILTNGINFVECVKKYVICDEGLVTEIISEENVILNINVEITNNRITKFYLL